MTKIPKIGDTAVLHFKIMSIKGNDLILRSKYGTDYNYNIGSVKEIIPAPWEPKSGDTVFYVGIMNHLIDEGVTFLYRHYKNPDDDRDWAVVAYKGDIPQSIKFSDLRRTYAECVA